MANILAISYSGIDNTVDLDELDRLVATMESRPIFGVLISQKTFDDLSSSPRFPNLDFIDDLMQRQKRPMTDVNWFPSTVVFHVCGLLAMDALIRPDRFLFYARPLLNRDNNGFFQLNLNAYPDPAKAAANLHRIDKTGRANTWIIQVRNRVGEVFVEELVKADGLTRPGGPALNVKALFDASMGAGIKPEMWPDPLDYCHCGYAGGITPENAAEIAKAITTMPNAHRNWGSPWLDMETGLRENQTGRDIFSLAKMKAIHDAILPFIHRTS